MVKPATKKIAIGALIAGASGYLAGILTAPKSGKETRKDVKVAALKAKTQAEKQLKKLHSDLSTNLEAARKRALNAKDASSNEINKAIASATKAKERVREMLSAIHEGGAEDKDLDAAIKDAKAAIEHLQQFATNEKRK